MAKPNVWLSVSDLMTGLMVIFLFVAIAYISRVQKNQSVLTDYVETKNEMHDKLVNEFAGDTLKWQMAIGKDLTMKFKEPTVLFATGSYELTLASKKFSTNFFRDISIFFSTIPSLTVYRKSASRAIPTMFPFLVMTSTHISPTPCFRNSEL